ncbi:hypothetical protein [Burkholderia lata]|uniref:Uncharacterized protein n=1 Tax=Burkholderia lata (strain ATCC 17760 / DSM 23089 / LMG 22485 / NCIMB 9086 / R18194 / 383) TaxID=482957 RepID=A0A6P2Q468_BURL3|nr:hypothetical protein [Burkholderia lata]VWC16442.1 hypothetical protein BLA6863_05624 [Burkholderia lata]
MKKILFVVLLYSLSVSAFAQFGQILQSVKDQVTSAAQTQVSQGVHSATNEAVDSATTHTHKLLDSVHSSDSSAPKDGQGAKPQ